MKSLIIARYPGTDCKPFIHPTLTFLLFMPPKVSNTSGRECCVGTSQNPTARTPFRRGKTQSASQGTRCAPYDPRPYFS